MRKARLVGQLGSEMCQRSIWGMTLLRNPDFSQRRTARSRVAPYLSTTDASNSEINRIELLLNQMQEPLYNLGKGAK